MTICHVRDFHECDCSPDQCKCAPPPALDTSRTPVFRCSVRAQMIFMLLASATIPLAIFIGAAMADPVIHQQILADQENVTWAK